MNEIAAAAALKGNHSLIARVDLSISNHQLNNKRIKSIIIFSFVMAIFIAHFDN
jgi:beta-lactamase regulating signal transducer with metallopeptidase domain